MPYRSRLLYDARVGDVLATPRRHSGRLATGADSRVSSSVSLKAARRCSAWSAWSPLTVHRARDCSLSFYISSTRQKGKSKATGPATPPPHVATPGRHLASRFDALDGARPDGYRLGHLQQSFPAAKPSLTAASVLVATFGRPSLMPFARLGRGSSSEVHWLED
jgi:hypothetical protein